ncbi:MFS transporter [Nocardia zapadnayensis]|uniref:MFS transporter n=1 Tax=Nocardia rhamnosiphila TaxID=426716 RepID=UPI00224612EF|nr:MFS transporter [Nocardia zapadnayensis]MCX0272830.1 MFS transporter [Nocardia zapadnayensis]
MTRILGNGMDIQKVRSVPWIVTGLVFAELVGAFESGMALQLLYSNDPFFGTDIAQLSWIMTAYTLIAAASVGVCGRLGDQFGRKRVLLAVLLISTIGTLVSALAPSVEVVIVGRAIQGVSASILPLTFGIARSALPSARVPLAITLLGITASGAGAGGILIAGVIIDHFTWQLMFYVCAALSVAACITTVFMIPKDSTVMKAGGRIDYVGMVLFSLGIWPLLYAVTKAGDWGLGAPRTLIFAAVGAVILLLWARWELNFGDPIVDIRRFRDAKFSLTMLATAMSGAVLLGMLGVFNKAVMRTPESITSPDGSILDLPVGLGFSATQAAIPSVLGAVVGFTLSPVTARLAHSLGATPVAMLGFGTGIVGYFSVLFTHQSPVAFVINMVVLSAGGVALTMAALPMMIIECVPEIDTSAATGMQLVTRSTFQAVGTALIGVVLAIGTLGFGSQSFMSQTGLTTAVVVGIAGSAIGLVMVVAADRWRPNGSGEASLAAETQAPEQVPGETGVGERIDDGEPQPKGV